MFWKYVIIMVRQLVVHFVDHMYTSVCIWQVQEQSNNEFEPNTKRAQYIECVALVLLNEDVSVVYPLID